MMARLMILVLLLGGGLLWAQEVQFLHDDVIDMGKVKHGAEISGSIRFVNAGAQKLVLDQVKPSCGCTVVTPERLEYASGDTANIPFIIASAGLHAGVIRKSIEVTFKNADPARYRFFVQANLVTELNISPRMVNFQRVAINPDTLITEFFEIENNTEQDIAIDKIYTNSTDLKITPETVTIPAGKSHLIRVEFRPTTAGRQNTKVFIQAADVKNQMMSIPVFINVQS